MIYNFFKNGAYNL